MEELKVIAGLKFTNDYWVLLLPCSLMAVDFLTGFLNAWLTGHIKSYVMRSGLAKKCGEVALLVAGELLTIGLNVPVYISVGVSAYIMLMEIISLFENLEKLGVPIPRFIKRALGTIDDIVQGEELSDEAKDSLKKVVKKKKTGKEG